MTVHPFKARALVLSSQTADYRPRPRPFRRPRLLIIGCGDIGQRLARLQHPRWQVIGLARSPATLDSIRQSGARALPASQSGQSGQSGQSASMIRRMARWATHIVHTAPPAATDQRRLMFGAIDPRTGLQPQGKAIATEGIPADHLTRHWLNALRLPRQRRRSASARPPRRLVYISTTGVYGNRHGAWVSENTPPQAQTDRARRRIDAERQIRQAGRQSPGSLCSLVLRVPGIYAEDRLPIERLRERTPALRPEDDVITNHIHADDLARIIRIALTRGPGQRIINTVDHTAMQLGDYLDLVASHTGLPRPPRRSRAQLEQELSPGRMSFMRESRRIANQRLAQELRYPLRYPTVQDFFARWPASQASGQG